MIISDHASNERENYASVPGEIWRQIISMFEKKTQVEPVYAGIVIGKKGAGIKWLQEMPGIFQVFHCTNCSNISSVEQDS